MMSNIVVVALIVLVPVGTYALILIKAHWSVRIVVSALLLIGSIKVTAWGTATRERNVDPWTQRILQ